MNIPGLPDININLPDLPNINLPDINIDLPDLPDLPDFPDLPGLPGARGFGTGDWPIIRDVDVPGMFWDLIDKIDRVTDKYGLPAPHLKPILRQLSLIDSDKFRQVARDVWGVGGEHAGIPAAVATEVPEQVNAAVRQLGKRWSGPAYDKFEGWMVGSDPGVVGGLCGVVKQYPGPAQQVGQVLVDLADKFDLTWYEIIGWVTTIAGAVVTLIAWAVPGGQGAAVVLTVIEAILLAVELLVTFLGSALPRCQAALAAMDTLINKVNQKIPAADDAHVPTIPTDDWTPTSKDPNR